MPITVDELDFSITAKSVNQATKAMDDLIARLEEFQDKAESASKSFKVKTPKSEETKKTTKYFDNFKEMKDISTAKERMAQMGVIAKEAGDATVRAFARSEKETQKFIIKLEEVSRKLQELGVDPDTPLAGFSAGNFARETWAEFADAEEKPKFMRGMSEEKYAERVQNLLEERDALELAAQEHERYHNELLATAKAQEQVEEDTEDATDAVEEQSRAFHRVGRSARHASGGLDKFTKMIARMTMLRAIRAAIREVAAGFSEGMENLYHYSDAMDSLDAASAKTSLDSVSTSLLYMKNSVGAAVAPLIQSLVPVLRTVVGWAVQAANAINMFISSLQGKTIYTRAKEYTTDFFDSVKTSASGAGKAAKEALATLLAFDEINRLDAPNNGGGGGGGGASSDIPDYSEMFEEAYVELPEWLNWIKDNFSNILGMVKDIGLGLAAWVIGNSIIDNASKLVGMLQTMTGLQKALLGGILLVIGVKWSFEGGKAIGEGTAGILDYIKLGLGAVASGIGGAFLGSAVGIGGAMGFAIGILVSLVATGVGIYVGEQAKIKNEFQEGFKKTELGKDYDFIRTSAGNLLQTSAELRMNIDSITGQIDAKTEGKLMRAEQLLKEIFGIDSKKNKSASEMVVLKKKIEEFNSLGLDDIQIEFDDTTGKVKSNRREVEKLIKSLRDRYQLEAYHDALTRSYEALAEAQYGSYEAEQILLKAERDLAQFEKTYMPKKMELQRITQEGTRLQNAYNEAVEKYGKNSSEATSAFKDLTSWQGIYNKALREANYEYNIVGETYEGYAKAVSDAKTALGNFGKAEADAYGKVQYFSGIIDGSIKNTKDYAGVIDDTTDSYKDIQQAAKDAAGAMGKIDNITMSNVNREIDSTQRKLDALGRTTVSPKIKISNASGSIPTGYYLQQKAEGGFVGTGDIFIANEAGPELIGTINGRTAVGSNQEITGISAAVYATGEREVAAINNLIRALNQKDMTAVVTADSIVAGLARKNRRDGVSTVPVSV